MPTINMRSCASKIKGQGVGSCYEEQVKLVSTGLSDDCVVSINKFKKTDIVHYHTINLNYFIERLLSRRRTAGIGYVHFLPDTLEKSLDIPFWIKKIFYRYVLSFYNSMDYLVAVNPTVVKKLENYGINRPKIVYIPNYVSEEKFFPQSPEKILASRAKYKLPKDRFVVLGVGQLQTRKGIHDFVAVAKQLPDVQFVWTGGFSFGKLSDGYFDIKQIVDNAPANVTFLGIIDREEMNDIYNCADMMFLPSYNELFPMAILEALCCKKPVLLRDIDVYPDILFDGYLKGDSVEEFTEAIESLAKNQETYRFWAEKSWSCHELYSEKHCLQMWEDLYREAYAKLKKPILLNEGSV